MYTSGDILGNLVDKEKLLSKIAELPQEVQAKLGPLTDALAENQLDFCPAQPTSPPGRRVIQAANIRLVCLGAYAGRPCEQHQTCRFITSPKDQPLPCEKIMASLIGKEVVVMDGSSVLHDTNAVKGLRSI